MTAPTPRRRAEDNMITPTNIAAHIASGLDGDYDDGLERHVRAQAKGTIIAVDLLTDGVVTESYILAVISAPVTS